MPTFRRPMMGEQRSRLSDVDLPGERRSVTGTYRYGDQLVSMVAQTVPELHAKANRRGDGPDECLSLSSPRSIYRDLTGETAERTGAKGAWQPFADRSLGT